MSDVERLARLEEQVSHLRNLLKWTALGLAALLGANSFFFVPKAAKDAAGTAARDQVDAQMPTAVEKEIGRQVGEIAKRAERWAVEAEQRAAGATESASVAAASATNAAASEAQIRELETRAAAAAAEMEAVLVQYGNLPFQMRLLAGSTWSWMRPVDEALAVIVNKGVAPEIERFRNLMGARQNEIAEGFGFVKTVALDSNPSRPRELKLHPR